jgi:hypothetical protein
MTRRTLPLFAAFFFASAYCIPAPAQAPMPAEGKAPPAKAAPGAAKPATPAKPGAATAADTSVSVEEIKQLVGEGKQREALQKLSRALATKGNAAAQYDRHELLRLKAEAHLGLKDAPAAASAFAAAAKEAKDDTARAEDKASELVIKRSKNLQFTPKPGKGGKAEPIDITTAEKRKAAFAALLEEEKATAAPTLKAAQKAKSLPPISDALKQAADLRMLELAATGADAETSKMIEEVAGQGQKLMGDAVKDMADLVKAIEASANDVQPVAVPARGPGGRGPIMYQSAKRKGLTTRDMQDLKRVIGDLKKLLPMARDLAAELGEQGKPFEKIADDGEATGNEAQKVLTTDYANDNAQNQGLHKPTEVRRR